MEFDLKQSDVVPAPPARVKRSHRWTALCWRIRYGTANPHGTLFMDATAAAFIKAAGEVFEAGRIRLIDIRDRPQFQRVDLAFAEAVERRRLEKLRRDIDSIQDARTVWAYRVWLNYLCGRLRVERKRAEAFYDAQAALHDWRMACPKK